jgi:ABC-type branched-subunit amino acid transport system substrate-binding protein
MNAHKRMRPSLGRLIPVGVSIGLWAFFLVGCVGKVPIRVGFAGQLTGTQAELGVQERNGVQMAVEEINAAGGCSRATDRIGDSR